MVGQCFLGEELKKPLLSKRMEEFGTESRAREKGEKNENLKDRAREYSGFLSK